MRWTNAERLSMIREHPKMTGAYAFAKAYYDEFARPSGAVIDTIWVAVVEGIGDERAISMLREQMPCYDRKQDIGDALGILQFGDELNNEWNSPEFLKSGRHDSNMRPPGPKPGALPG